MGTPIQIVRAMRPHQWVKNFAVFAALIFSKNLLDPTYFGLTVGAFICFCLLSSAIYLYNDLKDVESDRLHPTKRLRPIASGALSERAAWIASVCFAGLSFAGAAALVAGSPLCRWELLLVLGAYLLLQIVYTNKLKHVVILDVMSIAAGFILRMLAGGMAISVEVSAWVVICTTLLALFLGFGKRRHELIQMQDRGGETRAILKEYSPYYLDQMIAVVTASTVIAYSFYTMDPQVIAKLGTDHLNLTIPFVLFAVFRYLYLVHQKETGGNPTRTLLTDGPILIDIVLWFIAVNLIFYF